MLKDWRLWIITFVLVFLLLWYTYVKNDCIKGKECVAYVQINDTDTPAELKGKIQEIVDKAEPVIWPLALVIGFSVSLPLLYYVLGRSPNIKEWFVGILFLFVASYFAMGSWPYTHFYSPNFDRIIQAVNLL